MAHLTLPVPVGYNDASWLGCDAAIDNEKRAVADALSLERVPLDAKEECRCWMPDQKLIQVQRLVLIPLCRGWKPRGDSPEEADEEGWGG